MDTAKAMGLIKAAAAKVRTRPLAWTSSLQVVLGQICSDRETADAVLVITSAVGGKLANSRHEEPLGCDKLVKYLEDLLQQSVHPKDREDDLDWEAAFFVGNGDDPSAEENHLLSKLDKYASQWDGGLGWLAPYASVVQSSGWGKSYSICELRKHGVFVVYCSLMKPKRRGFPPRNELSRCFDETMSDALVCAYLVSSLEVLAESDLSPEEWLQCQIRKNEKEKNDIQGAIHARHKSLLPTMERLGTHNLQELVDDAVEQVQMQRRSSLRTEGELQILFAFDEGRELEAKMSQALHYLPEDAGLFAVFADTASNSSSPTRSEPDRSGRNRPHGQKLFDPVHLVGKADVHSDTNTTVSLLKSWKDRTEQEQTEAEATSALLQRLFLNGRPIWGAYYMNSNEPEGIKRLEGLVRFATRKLKDIATDLSRGDAAAVFMVCIGPELLSSSSLAQDLVAGHLATCVATVEGRQREIVTVHPSEGEAAAYILHRLEFLVPALGHLRELLAEGQVREAVRGELVMRIIILLCMHECARSSTFYTGRVKLRQFLQTMFGPDWAVGEGCTPQYLDACLCFNHFVPICSGVALDQSRLENFLGHGAGILYPPREFATDIGLPWVLDNGGEAVIGVLEIQRVNLSAGDASKAWSKLKVKKFPEQSSVPVITASFGYKVEHLEQQNGSATLAYAVTTGMYPFLEQNVVDALNHILKVDTDFRLRVPPEDVKYAEMMAVLSL